ncbi:MAG: MFS transporter, partial [Pseudomonadota bacterium]|nr:MFS transporter [Pseudomonadota bacterium]
PLDLLRNPVFALSICASICAFGAYMLTFISLPFHFENALGRSVIETGLLMTPWPLALGVTAPIAGRLSDRVSAAALGCAGMLLLALGLMLLALLPADASNADIAWRMALGGIGFGLFQSPNNRTMLSAAPRERAGAAGGMLATARLIGMTSGAALAAIMFSVRGERATPVNLTIGVALALAAAVASMSRRRKHAAPDVAARVSAGP